MIDQLLQGMFQDAAHSRVGGWVKDHLCQRASVLGLASSSIFVAESQHLLGQNSEYMILNRDVWGRELIVHWAPQMTCMVHAGGAGAPTPHAMDGTNLRKNENNTVLAHVERAHAQTK